MNMEVTKNHHPANFIELGVDGIKKGIPVENQKSAKKEVTVLEKAQINNVSRIAGGLAIAGLISAVALGVVFGPLSLPAMIAAGSATGLGALGYGVDRVIKSQKHAKLPETQIEMAQTQNRVIAGKLNREKNDQGLNYTTQLTKAAKNIVDTAEIAKANDIDFNIAAEIEDVVQSLVNQGEIRKPAQTETFGPIVRRELTEKVIGFQASKKKEEIVASEGDVEAIKESVQDFTKEIALAKKIIAKNTSNKSDLLEKLATVKAGQEVHDQNLKGALNKPNLRTVNDLDDVYINVTNADIIEKEKEIAQIDADIELYTKQVAALESIISNVTPKVEEEPKVEETPAVVEESIVETKPLLEKVVGKAMYDRLPNNPFAKA